MEKYVRVGFVVAGILTWMTMAALTATVFDAVNPNLDKMLIGAQFTISDLVGLIAGIVVGSILWFNERVNQLGMEVANELRNVTWPTWSETRVSTVVVIAMTMVVAVILALFDAIWGALSSVIYKL